MSISVEHKAEELAREAADRAATLATEEADRRTAIAVARAVKDANIDRDLKEHTEQLAVITKTQQETAAALATVRTTLTQLAATFEQQTLVQTALAKAVQTQRQHSWSRRNVWLTAAGVIAGYGSLVALLLSHWHS